MGGGPLTCRLLVRLRCRAAHPERGAGPGFRPRPAGSDDFFRMQRGQLLIPERDCQNGQPPQLGLSPRHRGRHDALSGRPTCLCGRCPGWGWRGAGRADGHPNARTITREMVKPPLPPTRGANVLLPNWDCHQPPVAGDVRGVGSAIHFHILSGVIIPLSWNLLRELSASATAHPAATPWAKEGRRGLPGRPSRRGRFPRCPIRFVGGHRQRPHDRPGDRSRLRPTAGRDHLEPSRGAARPSQRDAI